MFRSKIQIKCVTQLRQTLHDNQDTGLPLMHKINMPPLCTRTEKDTLKVRLEGHVPWDTHKMQGYLMFFLSKISVPNGNKLHDHCHHCVTLQRDNAN